MRRLINLGLSLWVLTAATQAQAANGPELTDYVPVTVPTLPQNVVTVEPGDLLRNRLILSYEHTLTPYVSLTVTPSVKWTGVQALDFMNRVGWFKLGAGLRWYPAGHAPAGFFMGPNGAVASVWGDAEGVSTPQGPALSANLMFGYAWVFNNVLDMSVAGGVQYSSLGWSEFGGRGIIMPAAEFKIGPAF